MISSRCREPPKQRSKVSFAATEHTPGDNSTRTISTDGTAPHTEANTDASPENAAREDTPAEAARLLAAVAGIAAAELRADPGALPRFPALAPAVSGEGRDDAGDPGPALLLHFDHRGKKRRAVSLDFHARRASFGGDAGQADTPYRTESEYDKELQETLPPSGPPSPPPPHEEEVIPILLQWRHLQDLTATAPDGHGIFSTPPRSPMASRRRQAEGIVTHSADPSRPSLGRPRAVSMAEGASGQIPVLDLTAPDDVGEKPKKLILKKKFSWKNYAVLEKFLIANREEYLRHSTLNYTVQQKKYNNLLTARMIALASEHGYAFDAADFSFVAVRDRIRCYYKSYVQTMKKQGVVVGYAARRAGQVTEEELAQSAHTNGKIYGPGC